MTTVPRSISVRQLVADARGELALTVAGGSSGLDREVRGNRVQKSGLALVGHLHGITPSRIQVLGVTEMTFLLGLEAGKSRAAVERFLELDLCCIVVTEAARCMQEGSAVADQLLRSADAAETPLLLSNARSSHTITVVHGILSDRLAPRARVHGVLVDVFEVGLLLLGDSGVGKSEVALELIMRGHRLVADDVVDCQYRHPSMVFGAAANLLRHHLEVRGLGILNVKNLFGVTSVRERKRIDVVVRLAEESTDRQCDRLGLDERHHTILGVEIPELFIPVRPGRDMASIMEIAARNELLKQAGHHPAQEFIGRLESSLMGQSTTPIFEGDVMPSSGPRIPSSMAPPSPRPAISRPPESIAGYPWQPKK